MATYQRTEVVEARQYDGPRITVVSDKYGEQIASKGDYLIGTEPRKVHVLSAAEFEAAYKPVSDDAEKPAE